MAKDIFHQAVRIALEKDGWSITHDPYPIRLLGLDLDIDLGAERVLAAEREEGGKVEKIAVEVKSFVSVSFMKDFHQAVGQYTNYKVLLEEREQDRMLFLAVPKAVYERRFVVPGVQLIRRKTNISLLIFDEETLTIDQWER
jgi:hypothetical protein